MYPLTSQYHNVIHCLVFPRKHGSVRLTFDPKCFSDDLLPEYHPTKTVKQVAYNREQAGTRCKNSSRTVSESLH